MYVLIAFIPVFAALGTLVYAMVKHSAKDELAQVQTVHMRVIERKLHG